MGMQDIYFKVHGLVEESFNVLMLATRLSRKELNQLDANLLSNITDLLQEAHQKASILCLDLAKKEQVK